MNERNKKKKNGQLMGNERQSSHPITEKRKRIRNQVSIYYYNRLIIPFIVLVASKSPPQQSF